MLSILICSIVIVHFLKNWVRKKSFINWEKDLSPSTFDKNDQNLNLKRVLKLDISTFEWLLYFLNVFMSFVNF